MRRRLLWTLALVPATLTAANAQAEAPRVADSGGITIERAWAGATPGRARTGAVYMTVTDHGAPDRIVGVSTPVAETAGIYQSSNEDGVMRMRPVDSLPIAPGTPIALAPGGYHIMLTGLKHPLGQGETFPVKLTFGHAAPVTATVTVERAGALVPTDHGAMRGHGMGMDGQTER
ncbi:copper chaperone PCu(A)C [Limobrevibacterium gyesilva]|uniref:Copper chaperone PCu(A)C n=1 Tax=Limobrevibacterium gyesilva TaxID=2991712 RepID=A0AA42CGC1_9PROT|nr:copper chaperone PCu(A)C [Limobrevibacterium gyesilva]MCW3477544.1 copper chaperone PCu(A)C [Limobrevibacterium gyesilva]